MQDNYVATDAVVNEIINFYLAFNTITIEYYEVRFKYN